MILSTREVWPALPKVTSPPTPKSGQAVTPLDTVNQLVPCTSYHYEKELFLHALYN